MINAGLASWLLFYWIVFSLSLSQLHAVRNDVGNPAIVCVFAETRGSRGLGTNALWSLLFIKSSNCDADSSEPFVRTPGSVVGRKWKNSLVCYSRLGYSVRCHCKNSEGRIITSGHECLKRETHTARTACLSLLRHSWPEVIILPLLCFWPVSVTTL